MATTNQNNLTMPGGGYATEDPDVQKQLQQMMQQTISQSSQPNVPAASTSPAPTSNPTPPTPQTTAPTPAQTPPPATSTSTPTPSQTPTQPISAGFQGVKYPGIDEVKSMNPRDLDIYLQWVAGNGIGYDPSGYVGVLLSQARNGQWGELATNIAARQREMQKFGLDRAKEYAQRVKEYVGTPQEAQAEQNWGAAARQALEQATKQWELAPPSLRGDKPPTYQELLGKVAATNPYDVGGVAYTGPAQNQSVPTPTATPTPATAPNTASGTPAPTSNIPFKEGLSDAQKASITTLSSKPFDKWTLTDKSNWNYATNSAPFPGSAGTGTASTVPASPASSATSAPPSPVSGSSSSEAIPFKEGLSDAQRQSIQQLSQKPTAQWTATDYANWNYATNNAATPSPAASTPSSVSTGGSSIPAATTSSAASPEMTDFDAQYQALFDKYKAAHEAGPSTEEAGTQAALDKIIAEQAKLSQAKALGLETASEQPIELGFVTGQQAAIERRAANALTGLTAQEIPLKARLAMEQAKRQASLDVADKEFELERSRLEKKESAQNAQRVAEAKANAIKTLSPGQSLIDPETGEVLYTAPPKESTAGKTYVKATKYQPAGYVDSEGNFTPLTETEGGGGQVHRTSGGGGGNGGGGTGGLQKNYSPAEKRELDRLGINDDATAGIYLTSEPAFQTWYSTQQRTTGAHPTYDEIIGAKSYWTNNVKAKPAGSNRSL